MSDWDGPPLTADNLARFVSAQRVPECALSIQWVLDAVTATTGTAASREVLDALPGDITMLSDVNVAAFVEARPGVRAVPWWVAGASGGVDEIGSAVTEFTFVYDYAL
eukprot:2673461-Rhodomonas_salina.1